MIRFDTHWFPTRGATRPSTVEAVPGGPATGRSGPRGVFSGNTEPGWGHDTWARASSPWAALECRDTPACESYSTTRGWPPGRQPGCGCGKGLECWPGVVGVGRGRAASPTSGRLRHDTQTPVVRRRGAGWRGRIAGERPVKARHSDGGRAPQSVSPCLLKTALLWPLF